MKRILFFSSLLVILVACGPGEKSQTTITWWQFWTDAGIKPLIQEMVTEFETTHPGIKVNIVDLTWADGHDKIAMAFSSGFGPDVLELGSDWISEFAVSGHLADLTAQVDSIKTEYIMWESATLDGRCFAFPWILGTRVLFANAALLKKAGYAEDFIPQNWPELLAAVTKIDGLDDQTFGFASNSAEKHRLYKKFLPLLWANGGAILSFDGNTCLLADTSAVAALEYYLKLCRHGLTDNQRRLEDAFIEGKIGFIISGDWLLKRLEREEPAIEFKTFLIPGPDGLGSSCSFAGGEFLSLNARSSHPIEAMALIRHLCAPKNQLRFCLENRSTNPSSKRAAADSILLAQPHFAVFVRQMETAQAPPVHPKWVYIEGILERAIEQALYEVKTPRQALDDAAAEIEELIRP